MKHYRYVTVECPHCGQDYEKEIPILDMISGLYPIAFDDDIESEIQELRQDFKRIVSACDRLCALNPNFKAAYEEQKREALSKLEKQADEILK